jgi:hypothetical protein
MQCNFESCEILLAPQSQSIDFGRRVVLNKDRASPFTIHVLMDSRQQTAMAITYRDPFPWVR